MGAAFGGKTDQEITLSHLEWDPEFRGIWRVTG
jgi:hypothetical protein